MAEMYENMVKKQTKKTPENLFSWEQVRKEEKLSLEELLATGRSVFEKDMSEITDNKMLGLLKLFFFNFHIHVFKTCKHNFLTQLKMFSHVFKYKSKLFLICFQQLASDQRKQKFTNQITTISE